MKHIFLSIGFLLAFSAPVYAQSSYDSAYPPPVFSTDPDEYATIAPQSGGASNGPYRAAPTYRVYPGREHYGSRYGRIPRHPGDYRDAVDRGGWSSGQPNYSR